MGANVEEDDDDLYNVDDAPSAALVPAAQPTAPALAPGPGRPGAASGGDEPAAELERWRAAFRDLVGGTGTGGAAEPTPAAVLDAMLALKASERKLRDAVATSQRRESAATAAAAAARREVAALKLRLKFCQGPAAPTPELLLDPAVNAEFQRLLAEADELRKLNKRTQDDMVGISFTHESAHGRDLMNRVREVTDKLAAAERKIAEGEEAQSAAALKLVAEHARELQARLDARAEDAGVPLQPLPKRAKTGSGDA